MSFLRRHFVFLVFVIGLFSTGAVAADTKTFFPDKNNSLADVEKTIKTAEKADKLALVILGANWCHDSKALMERIDQSPLSETVSERFEMHPVNVGWFKRGFDVAEKFGLKIYTHTPTVLIIDPATGTVVNRHDHHQWRDAAEISDEETTAYFETKAKGESWSVELPSEIKEDPVFQRLMADIDTFEAEQADRIRAAYAILGPKMEEKADDRYDYWKALRSLRYQLPDDLLMLRNDVTDLVSVGETDIELTFPEYSTFFWEQE